MQDISGEVKKNLQNKDFTGMKKEKRRNDYGTADVLLSVRADRRMQRLRGKYRRLRKKRGRGKFTG